MKKRKAQALPEIALIIAMISLIVVGSLGIIGDGLVGISNKIKTGLTDVNDGIPVDDEVVTP